MFWGREFQGIMVDKNDTLLREVDEELRREQLEKLWKRHGNLIMMGAAALVLAYGAGQIWQARRIAASEAAGASFEDARRLIAENKPADAAKALETLSKGGQPGYADLATLQLAGNEVKAGRKAEALALFESLGKSATDTMLRDYARLQAASLRLGEADFTEIQNRLTDVLGDKNPWRAAGRELLGLAAMKAGKMELAKGTFQQLLADRNTPQGISERARIAMARIVEAELASPPPAAVSPAAGMSGMGMSGMSGSGMAAPTMGGMSGMGGTGATGGMPGAGMSGMSGMSAAPAGDGKAAASGAAAPGKK